MKSHGLEMKGPLGSSDGVDAIEFTDVTGAVTVNTDLEIDGETQLDGTVKITGGTPLAGKVLYTTDTNGTLSWKYQSVPSGKTVLFEKDSSVTGYTMETDEDDLIAYITSSESGFGTTWTAYWGDTVYWNDGPNCNYSAGDDWYYVSGPGGFINEAGTWNVGYRPDKIRLEGFHDVAGTWDVTLDNGGTLATVSFPEVAGTEYVHPNSTISGALGGSGCSSIWYNCVNSGINDGSPTDASYLQGIDDSKRFGFDNPTFSGYAYKIITHIRAKTDNPTQDIRVRLYADGSTLDDTDYIGISSGTYANYTAGAVTIYMTAAELANLEVEVTVTSGSFDASISEIEVEIFYSEWQTVEADITFGSDISQIDIGSPGVGRIRNIEFGVEAAGIPGEEGGTNKSGGTWTQPTHDHGGSSTYTGYTVLTIAMMPSHRHAPQYGGSFLSGGSGAPAESGDDFRTSSYTGYSGGTYDGGPAAGHRHTLGSIDADATVNTWRPYGRNITRQTKN